MCIFEGLGLGPGDEVITVGHTFNATVSAILFTGATPVFVDIEPDTYVIDAARIEAAITPRTRAICPVHLFGLPADMDMIRAIADRHGLAVVEDACQAHGAEFRGRRVGSFGHGAFSLYGTKNMTTGEGGLITTDDDRLADWIRLYRNQGMRERYHHEILGYNFRLTDIAAAIGLCQLDKLERNTARRRAIAARYDEAFASLPIRTPVTPEGRTHVFHQYTVDVGPERDAIVEDLAAAGVSTGIYYPIPVHRQPYVLERGISADLPVTDAAAARTLSLPMYPGPDRRRAGPGHRAPSTRPIAPDACRPAKGPPLDDGRLVAARATRVLRVGLIGLGLDGPQPPARPRDAGGRRRSPRSPIRTVTPSPRRVDGDRRAGVRGAARPARRGRPRRRVIAAPTTTHLPHRAGGHRPRHRGPRSRSRWRRRRTRRRSIVRAASAIGAPPVQVGHIERFNPAVLELGRLLEAGWLSTVYAITSRRAGPFPARIRDVGVTVDLATHDVDILSCDRRRATDPRLGRDGPAHPRQPRGPPVRPDVVPVRDGRDARRRLADAGQAPPAARSSARRACSSSTT